MKVSIITVCYNSSQTIEDTIKSVVGQDYTNIEYIIVDGLSK
ncbi:MAG: glycosyltransferase, partial [Bacteroidota bacterium]